jgi:hypothetical protein
MICNSSEMLLRQTKSSFKMSTIGFLMDFAQPKKVVKIVRIPRHQGRLHGNPEMITVLEGLCEDGTSLEPLIIIDGDRICHNWFDNAEHVPHAWLFGSSPNGWTDSTMAMNYYNFGL